MNQNKQNFAKISTEGCSKVKVRCYIVFPIVLLEKMAIGIFEPPKCDVNPQPNTRGIGSLVGRTSGYRRSVMRVLAVMFSITYHFSFICQYNLIRVKWSGREICPLLMYPSKFFIF